MGASMRDMGELLSEENCRAIVENYLGHPHATIINHDIKPLENSLDGLIGEQYTVEIVFEDSGKKDALRVFFKILNGKCSTMFELSKEIKAFEKEDFFYNQLIPKFEETGIDMSFVPKCYLCFPYTVVLEDLSVQSFKSVGKCNLLDLESSKHAMNILAKFHAASVVYERKQSSLLKSRYKLYDEYPDMLDDVLFTQNDSPATKWLKCSIEGLFKIIDMLPDSGESRERFKSKLKITVEELLNEKSDIQPCSILHGDLWSNNFLFRRENGVVIDTKLIDFQTIKYGPVALDVEQFIMTNTRKLFRDSHDVELLEHYFRSFTEIIKQHGYDPAGILSEDDFITSCQMMKLPAKIQAIVDRSLTFMPDEVFGEVMKDEEQFSRFLFADRGRYIVESYTKNDQFRELILEDMLELRDLLFSD